MYKLAKEMRNLETESLCGTVSRGNQMHFNSSAQIVMWTLWCYKDDYRYRKIGQIVR